VSEQCTCKQPHDLLLDHIGNILVSFECAATDMMHVAVYAKDILIDNERVAVCLPTCCCRG
jgi:hypothetical protein